MSDIPKEVEIVLHAQQEAIKRLTPEHATRLRQIAKDVQDELERQLKALTPGRFTTQQTRAVLAQVRAIVELLGAEYGVRIGSELERLAALAAAIGRDGLVKQIAAWADTFPGAVRPLSHADVAGDLLDPGLLEFYDTSKATYGMDAIRRMRDALVKSSIASETVNQTAERLSTEMEMQDWRAERIVRTEAAFASQRRALEDAKAADLGLAKQLVAIHDDRTGEDSLFVDGQVRPLDEPFVDNEGRRYQHPPNRPNDREVIVFVPESLVPHRTKPVLPPDETRRPKGRRTKNSPNDSKEQRRSNKRENEAAEALSCLGFDVEQNPAMPGRGHRERQPDFRISGELWDCYSPEGANPARVAGVIGNKLAKKQAQRFIVNAADWRGDVQSIRDEILKLADRGLVPIEVIVLPPGGGYIHVYP